MERNRGSESDLEIEAKGSRKVGSKTDRPITTLFMLMSVDGKISPGASDELDVDKDFPEIEWLKDKPFPGKTPVSFVLLDNSHLTEHGVTYFCRRSKEFVLITSNRDHPAYNVKESNLHIIFQETLSLNDALRDLKKNYGCERMACST